MSTPERRNRIVASALVVFVMLALAGVGTAADTTAGRNRLTCWLPLEEVAVQGTADGTAVFNSELRLLQPGAPALPLQVATFLLPPDADPASVEVFVESPVFHELPGEWDVAPAPPDRTSAGEGTAGGRDAKVYDRDAMYPGDCLGRVAADSMRQWRLVHVEVMPYQYNPVQRKLYRLGECEMVITFDRRELPSASAGGPGVSSRAAGRYVDRAAVNFADMAGLYSAAQDSPADLGRYVIITTSSIQSASTKLSAFAASKEAQGYTVQVATGSTWGGGTGDTAAENIRDWLAANYASLNIQCVLLVGNPNPGSGDVPMKMCYAHSTPSYEQSPTDFYYAELTGNWDLDSDGRYGEYNGDYGPGGASRDWEVIVGRIPYYGSITDLDDILDKIMTYQAASTADAAWRKMALLPMKPSDASTPGYHLGEAIKDDFVVPKGDWGYHRVYDEDYGLTPAPEVTPCTKPNVRDAWNAEHPGATFWWTHGSATSASDVMDTTYAATLNDTYPTFTFQCSCNNGYPENTGNLGYTLLKNGAVSTVSASRVSWYSPGQTSYSGSSTNAGMTYEYARRLISSEMEAGEALMEVKQIVTPMATQTRWMNCLVFNLYGDPAVGVFTSGVGAIHALQDDVPETFSTITKDFSFGIINYDWAAVGINPAPNDHDIMADDNSDFSSPYQDSTYVGSTRDFVVANGHQWGSATHYARVHYGSSSNYTIEGEWDIPDIFAGGSVAGHFNSTYGPVEVLDLYESYLTAGENYTIVVDITSGSTDVALFLFKPSRISGRRSSHDGKANANGAGGDESMTFTATETGDYGILLVNENGSESAYSVRVQISVTITAIQPTSGPPWTQGKITGIGFGAAAGSVKYTPDGGAAMDWTVLSWSDTEIAFRVSDGTPVGTGQVHVETSGGSASNSVAFEVTDPTVIHVDDDNTTGIENGTLAHPFNTIQEGENAVDAGDHVIVLPGTYTENVLMTDGTELRAQTVGTATIDGNHTGSVIQAGDGIIYGFILQNGSGTPHPTVQNYRRGGGIYVPDNKTVTIDKCVIRQCSPNSGMTLYGGAVGAIDATANVVNCQLSDNHADYGTGIYNLQGQGEITNTTIVGNTVDIVAGGIDIVGATVTVRNCVICNNEGAGIRHVGAGSVTVEYSDVWGNDTNYDGAAPGPGCISADPLFVGGGDYALTAGSPCIDAADGDVAPSTDIDGNGRHDDPGVWDTGVGTPTYVDMGCHEFQGTSVGIEVIVDNTDNNAEKTFTMTPDGDWERSNLRPDFYGNDYRLVNTMPGAGDAEAEWQALTLPSSYCEVFAWYPAHTCHTQTAKYIVHSAQGDVTVAIDQTQTGGQWVSLGTFAFAPGEHKVSVGNDTSTPGRFVIADAVKFVTVEAPAEATLQVFLEPPEAITAGAKWYVDGGLERSSGDIVTLTPGDHTVTYKDIGSDWQEPSGEVVTLGAGEARVLTRTYTQIPPPCIVDNADNTLEKKFERLSGTWATSSSLPDYYATNYTWERSASGETKRARWSCTTLPAGNYNVYAWWAASSSRATNVPYVMRNGVGGPELGEERINQKVNGGQWNLLGAYPFDAGCHVVEIHNSDTSSTGSYVCADAVKFEWAGSSHTVSTPDTPQGPTTGDVGTSYTYTAGGSTCSEGHAVEYRFDWGDATMSPWSASTSASHAWAAGGAYEVKAQGRCSVNHAVVSSWSSPLTVTIGHAVSTPDTPTGETAVERDTSYPYTTGGSTCSQGHAVEYRFDWDDSTMSPWSADTSASHAWADEGTYRVKAQARCSVDHAVVSDWSQALTVVCGGVECIVDNLDNTLEKKFERLSGTWATSHTLPGYYASDYTWERTAGGETKRARWSCTTLPAGNYNVYAWWTASSSRATNVPYVMKNGATELGEVRVNQKVNGGQWNLLGTYTFDAGGHVVEIHNGDTASTGDYVCGDAVRFVRVP